MVLDVCLYLTMTYNCHIFERFVDNEGWEDVKHIILEGIGIVVKDLHCVYAWFLSLKRHSRDII